MKDYVEVWLSRRATQAMGLREHYGLRVVRRCDGGLDGLCLWRMSPQAARHIRAKALVEIGRCPLHATALYQALSSAADSLNTVAA